MNSVDLDHSWMFSPRKGCDHSGFYPACTYYTACLSIFSLWWIHESFLREILYFINFWSSSLESLQLYGTWRSYNIIIMVIIRLIMSLLPWYDPYTYSSLSLSLSLRPDFETIENGLNCLLGLLRSQDREKLKKYSDFRSLTSSPSPVLHVFSF